LPPVSTGHFAIYTEKANNSIKQVRIPLAIRWVSKFKAAFNETFGPAALIASALNSPFFITRICDRAKVKSARNPLKHIIAISRIKIAGYIKRFRFVDLCDMNNCTGGILDMDMIQVVGR